VSKYVDMIGWEDAPHLLPPYVDPEVLADLEKGMLPHQRQARRTGRPSLGSGAIYPINEDDIFVDPFKIPEHFEQAYGLDVGWNKTAALLGWRDPDLDIIYLAAEHYRGEVEPFTHVHSIKAWGDWILGAIDPAAEGSNQKDGTKLREAYEELGLQLVRANNAVAAGLHECLVRFQDGRLKVFTTLTNWRKEFRLYRRDEKGKIVKQNDHLMDAMRYLVNTDSVFSTKPIQTARRRSAGEW